MQATRNDKKLVRDGKTIILKRKLGVKYSSLFNKLEKEQIYMPFYVEKLAIFKKNSAQIAYVCSLMLASPPNKMTLLFRNTKANINF